MYNEYDKEFLDKISNSFKPYIKKVRTMIMSFVKKVKDFDFYLPFFEEYGYNINYLNKVIYTAKYSKKKRVRNKYRNMIKRTLGEEKLNLLLED